MVSECVAALHQIPLDTLRFAKLASIIAEPAFAATRRYQLGATPYNFHVPEPVKEKFDDYHMYDDNSLVPLVFSTILLVEAMEFYPYLISSGSIVSGSIFDEISRRSNFPYAEFVSDWRYGDLSLFRHRTNKDLRAQHISMLNADQSNARH
jgi:hypothetical protein